MPKNYDKDFKKEVVSEYIRTGKSQIAIAREYNISKSALGSWIREYNEECQYTTKENNGEAAREIRRLNRELREKEKEIAFLKKAAAFFAKEAD